MFYSIYCKELYDLFVLCLKWVLLMKKKCMIFYVICDINLNVVYLMLYM